MIFEKTELKNLITIKIERKNDERGFFARQWDLELFENEKLNSTIKQCNLSFTKRKGTIRGMHYQVSPFEEVKLIRCVKGSIFDVVIDLRKKSKTYKQWKGFRLSENDYQMIYVPEGFAHGFQTLEDNTEIFYQVSEKYSPDHERGIKWDDPEFKIEWPISSPIISKKDQTWNLFSQG